MSDFHYDPFHTGGEDELSKFENFMHHQQRHHPQRQQTPNQQYHRHDGFSPRSEDGMSYVSRMKHKNYAKVVQEMKMKQSGDDDVDDRNHYHAGGQRQQQHYPQQQQQGRGGRGDARRQSMQPQQYRSEQGFETTFNNANQFSAQAQQHEYQYQQYAATASHLQQQQQQQQSYYNGHPGKMSSSSPQPLAPSRADRSPAHNHCNNSANNPSLVSNDNNHASFPTRTGRKLFQDPSDSHASRSRSTVRRTADRTLQLAMLASNTDSHDTMSDVGSVFSSYSVSGESLAGYPSHRQNQFNRQSSNNSNLSSKSLSNSLDAFVAKSKANFGSSSSSNNNSYNNEEESCSVVSGVSGAGSVAARRRAAKNRQYPPQHSTYNGKGNDFNPTSTATTPSSNKQRAIAPPPHQSAAYTVSPGAASVASSTTSSAGAAVSARSRMRMRMQQAATSSNVTTVRTTDSGDPSSPGVVVPISKQASMNQNLQSQQQQQQQQQQQTPPQPKRPVLFCTSAVNDNMNLSSDTIEHEVNLALSELKLSHPEIIDVDFISTISRLESGGSVGDASLCNSIGGGVIECAGGSGSGSGSTKGVGLKKTSGAGVGGGTGRISPHTVSTKSMTIINSTVVDPPTASSTAVAATATGQNAVISPVISVEQYSESSSLTDDVGSDSCNNNRTSGVSNIFKDAERMGSTFHKSKKIVRPGESVIPEERQVISSGVVPTQSSTTTPPPSSTSSVRDRISGLNKDSSSPGVRAASNQFPRTPEEAAPSTSNASPSVGSKAKHNLPSKSSTPNTPPRPSSSSSPIVQSSSTVGNPFAVQLRKTNLPPLGSTPSITRSSPPAFKKGTTDSTNVTTAKTTDATRVASSSPVVPQSLPENVISREGTNPFLAGIKLRPTFGGGASGIVGVAPQKTENGDITKAAATDSCQGVANENTKQKLSYREQQELIRQQQRPEENEKESTHSTAEAPKKDVATLIRERIAASKTNTVSNNDFSRGAASNKNNLNSIGTITKPAAAISPGHDPKDCTDTVVSSSSEKESEADPRAALMAMLNKRAAKESLPAATSAPMRSEVMKGENAKSVAKNALSTMFADRAKKESGEAQNIRDGPKNALLSSMLANRAPPQASSEYHGSRASDSEDQDGDTGGDERPALKNDPKYEKYFKMLKMGMPLPAVQHAMTRDGLDPSVMDGDHNLPEPQRVPLKDDPDYSKYFKMLKLGLPMGAVKNAMERDGIDPSVMDGDHNAPVSSSASRVTSSSNNMKQKDTHRRTRLHWDTLEDTKVNSNSVWALVGEDAELNQIEIDEQEFTTLFQAEIKTEIPSGGASGGGTVGGGGGGSNRNVVQVIDPKRANNGGIILARLRMSYDDMARAVETIDETVMTANQAQGIIEYMPTFAERKALRDYMKNSKDGESAAKCFERLCECEKFMVAMMTVKQSKRKIRALLFKLQFRGCIHDLARDVFLIEKACDELSNSVRLRKLFGIVLNIGNRLNTAGPGQKRRAGAFSIKSLLKLNQAKAFDNKTTFLHYVVLVVQRNNDALLDFKDDLPTVSKADKIYWDQCISELEEIETQLENVRKVSLHEAKSSKVMYQLPKKKKSADADNDSDDLSVESMSLEDEVQLLRSTKTGMFALSAIRKVSQLRERVDTAKDKFASLLEYLGESGNSKMQPHELFEIINTFCRTFDVARADVEKMEKVKKRDDKKGNDSDLGAKNEKLKAIQEVQSPESNKSPPTKVSTTPLPRASSHQPNMGNVLADLKRASLATFSTPATNSTSLNYGNGPPRVQHRHPDDESSPGASEGGPGASSSKSRHSRMQETKPASPSVQSLIRPAKVNLTGEASECVRKEQQAHSMEVARLETKVIEKRLVEEAAATEDDARQALLEKEADSSDEITSTDVHQRQKSGNVHHTPKSVVDVNNATPCDELARVASQQISQATEEAAAQPPETSDVKDSTGSENRTPDPIKTRRDMMLARRERARSRQPRVSSSPTRTTSSSIATAAIPPAPPATTAPNNFVQVDAQKPNNSSSHANTAALARERYARHKKMLQQRRG